MRLEYEVTKDGVQRPSRVSATEISIYSGHDPIPAKQGDYIRFDTGIKIKNNPLVEITPSSHSSNITKWSVDQCVKRLGDWALTIEIHCLVDTVIEPRSRLCKVKILYR